MSKKRAQNTDKSRGKHAAHAAPPSRPSVSSASNAKRAPHPAPNSGSTAYTGHIPTTKEAASTRTNTGKKSKKAKKAKKKHTSRAFKIVITVILVVVLAGGGFLVWDYLFRYNDKQDFQGQWKIEGTNASIVITDSEIKLTDSVSFGYELDTFAKTIKYSYANYTNEGSYVFSPERDVLTITDVNPNPDQGEEGKQSMHLLKVSNQDTGEPQTANNNDTSDAQTYGEDVVEGTMSPQQAQRDEQSAS